jgi:hypothetical protein
VANIVDVDPSRPTLSTPVRLFFFCAKYSIFIWIFISM